jgi:hypothetical protein
MRRLADLLLSSPSISARTLWSVQKRKMQAAIARTVLAVRRHPGRVCVAGDDGRLRHAEDPVVRQSLDDAWWTGPMLGGV